jgi:hypothetical protein
VNNYFNLIEFAHKNNLIIQSIPLTDPEYLAINILPKNIRLNLLQKYEETKNKILSTSTSFKTLTTGRDATRLDQQWVKECETIMSMLKEPEPENVDVLRKNLVFWMTKWDKVFNLNAFEFFPEYSDFLQDCGYRV